MRKAVFPPSRWDGVTFAGDSQTLRVWLPSGCAFGTSFTTINVEEPVSPILAAPSLDDGLHVRGISVIEERIFRQRHPWLCISGPKVGNRAQRWRVVERASVNGQILPGIGALGPKNGEAMGAPMDHSRSLVGLGSFVRLCFSLNHGHAVIRNTQRQDKARTGDRLTVGAVTGKQGDRLGDYSVADRSTDTAT